MAFRAKVASLREKMTPKTSVFAKGKPRKVLRYLPLIALLLTALCAALALLLALERRVAKEGMAPVTFNTSWLGYDQYQHGNTTFVDLYNANQTGPSFMGDSYDAVADLSNDVDPDEPSDHTNDTVASVTEAMGIRDWYTVHFDSYCCGFYNSKVEPRNYTLHGFLTDEKTRAVCHGHSGAFSLREVLNRTLNDEVKTDLLAAYDDISHKKAPKRNRGGALHATNESIDEPEPRKDALNIPLWRGFWYTALFFMFLALLLLLPALHYPRRLTSGWSFLALMLALTFFSLATVAIVGDVFKARTKYHHDPFPKSFMIMMWSLAGLLLLAFTLIGVEWMLEMHSKRNAGNPSVVVTKPAGTLNAAQKPPVPVVNQGVAV